MKILQVIPGVAVSGGGPATTMSNIVAIWQLAGHGVEILTIEESGKLMPVNGNLNIMPPSFPVRFGNSQPALLWLTERYREFDIVFFNCVWSLINLRLASLLRKEKRAYVVLPHGSLDPFDLQKKASMKKVLGPLFIRPYLQGSKAVLCSTQREADCLVTYGANCNIVTLPWPVSPVDAQADRVESRRHFGFDDDEFVILSLGRIDYKKGFPVLLPAVSRLVKAGIKVRLLIVGPDSNGYTTTVRTMVKSLRLENHIVFVPPVLGDEKKRIWKTADCFALPSLNENFGNVVVEAMQQSLPCVISNNVYICDAVKNGGAGIVCNYDEKEVFSALRQLAIDVNLRAAMAAAAMGVAETFAPDRLNAKYLNFLDDVTRLRVS